MKTLKELVTNAFKWFWNWGYKEEFLAIAGFFAMFLAINLHYSKISPEAGFFNLPSQAETLVYSIVKFVLALILIWVGYRIVFPKAYKFFREEIYQKFDDLPFPDKLNWALKILMILAFVAAVSIVRAQCPNTDQTRKNLVSLVRSQVGIHEITENDSPEIRKFLAHVGIYIHAYWCVAWVSYDLSEVGVENPKSAWSPNYAKPPDIIWTPKKPRIQPLSGDVITIYFANLKRVGHGCFYLQTDKSGYFITGEGNANQKLSRTGGEVCILKRDPKKIYAITRYIKP